jgi:DNA repair protein RadC
MEPWNFHQAHIVATLSTLFGEDASRVYERHERSLQRLIAHARESQAPEYQPLRAGVELVLGALREDLRERPALASPDAMRELLQLHFFGRQRETFVVLFLDAQHRLLEVEELFRGTLTQTSVYPREVVKRALHWNAAAVAFAHNHPSGIAEPSTADRMLTQALQKALALVDVRVLDHFVVGGETITSFAERGLL